MPLRGKSFLLKTRGFDPRMAITKWGAPRKWGGTTTIDDLQMEHPTEMDDLD